MLPTCRTHTFLTAKQKHNEEIIEYATESKDYNFSLSLASASLHSFRIGSVPLIRQIQTAYAESSCPRTCGKAPACDKRLASPAWILRRFLLTCVTVLLARTGKLHLLPWDQKVYSLKFKLCLKLLLSD